MFSSRITLSLLALAFCMLITLAWSAGELNQGYLYYQGYTAPLFYVPAFLCLVCIVFWVLTFFRSSGVNYMFSSRILLTVFSSLFGVFIAHFMVDLEWIEPINLRLLPNWQIALYAISTTLLALLWLGVYFKVPTPRNKFTTQRDI